MAKKKGCLSFLPEMAFAQWQNDDEDEDKEEDEDTPLQSKTGWTGDFWSNGVFLILENQRRVVYLVWREIRKKNMKYILKKKTLDKTNDKGIFIY